MAQHYEQIDTVIESWALKHGLTIFTGTEGSPSSFRCAYLSSERGECCQIWIEPPHGQLVSLHAAEVETLDGELRADWAVPISQLGPVLDQAIAHVRQWFARGLAGAG